MIKDKKKMEIYYKALLEKDKNFDGIFFVAIKTTGIFCHATCRAKKPKFDNCIFFEKAEEALLNGFRPCKICNPLSYPQDMPKEVKILIEAVEKNPEKRWKDQDFKDLGIHSMAARRKFKEIYNMTFIQYARSRRMGMALRSIQEGEKVIEQQLAMGYNSASGFNDAFSKIMGNPPKKAEIKLITATFIMTPIGRMIALADENYLYLLEFDNRRGLEKEIEKLRLRLNARIIYGSNSILLSLKKEIDKYFDGELNEFTIPLFLMGSEFQKSVWEILKKISMGETRTYKDIAIELGDTKKVRAVGNANGANQIAILIPCHRIIESNGELGGYGGGIKRKEYLLNLEKNYKLKREK